MVYNTEEKKFFGYISEKGKNLFDIIKKNKNLDYISLFIGPEGDFSNNEINLLEKNGWEGVYLSPYIFKSETAAIYLSSIIFFNSRMFPGQSCLSRFSTASFVRDVTLSRFSGQMVEVLRKYSASSLMSSLRSGEDSGARTIGLMFRR